MRRLMKSNLSNRLRLKTCRKQLYAGSISLLFVAHIYILGSHRRELYHSNSTASCSNETKSGHFEKFSSLLVFRGTNKCDFTLLELSGVCKDTFQEKKFAVALHLGDRVKVLGVKSVLYTSLRRLKEVLRGELDIYINVRSIAQVEFVYSDPIWKAFEMVPFISIQKENRGMDIGGFFHSLLAMSQLCRRYKIVLKMHSKEDQKWLRNTLEPLVGSRNAIENMVTSICSHEKNIGIMAGTSLKDKLDGCFQKRKERLFFAYELGDINYLSASMPHEDRIMSEMGVWLPRRSRMFNAGTIFAMHGEVIFRYFKPLQVKLYLADMNVPTSVDLNWFTVMSRLNQTKNLTLESLMLSESWPGNSLFAHHMPGILPDAQVEHAWERIFFYLSHIFGMSISLQIKEGKSDYLKEIIIPPQAQISEVLNSSSNCWDEYNLNRNVCMLATNESATCFMLVNNGECLLKPALMSKMCGKLCDCLRMTGKRGWNTHLSRLKFITSLRREGPFHKVSKKYMKIYECLNSRVKHEFSFPPLPEQIQLDSNYRVGICTRLNSNSSEYQALIDKSGGMSIYNDEFDMIWSNIHIPAIRFNYFMMWLYKRFSWGPSLYVLTSDRSGVLLSPFNFYHVIRCQMIWCSTPLQFQKMESLALKLTSDGCVLLVSFASNRSWEGQKILWTSCYH